MRTTRDPDEGLAETIRGFPDAGVRAGIEHLLRSLPGSDGLDLRERLTRVVFAVRDETELPNVSELTAAELGSFLRLIDLLRAAVLERWASGQPPDVGEMLRFLSALERVRQSLHRGNDLDTLAATFAVVQSSEVLMELAHDIRSPLTSILFLSETLRRGQSGTLTELQHVQLGIVYSAALSLLSMASDVTELARSGDQLPEKHPSSCAIGEILSSVSDLVSPMIDHRKLILRIVPPKNDLRIGYPMALRRVLLNLTTNALKFTERGLIEIVAKELDLTGIEFSVRDTGQGIHPDMQTTLFEPFRTRATNGKIGLSGTGLGLWTSKRLVAAMGGELRFETKPGWGTRFFFQLHLPPVPPIE